VDALPEEKPSLLPEPFDLTRRVAVIDASLLAMHNLVLQELTSRIDLFYWVSITLGSVENGVHDEVHAIVDRLKTDHESLHEHDKLVARLQQSAVRGADDLNNVSEECLASAAKIEENLAARAKELAEIMARVAKLQGSRIPPLPPRLIRPSKLAPILEALQRLSTGYLREKLQK